MTQEQANDLLWLAGKLRTHHFYAPVERFRMHAWCERTIENPPESIEHVCGTSACAAGWFCLWRPNDVIQLRPSKRFPQELHVVHSVTGTIGFDALMERFDITESETQRIFSDPGWYDEERHVPERVAYTIEDVVKRNGFETKREANGNETI